MMPYGEALQQVEQGQGQLQQQYPYTYGGGEIGGSLASFLGGTKLATAGLSAGQKAVGLGTKIAAPAMVGGVQSGVAGVTSEMNKPNYTMSDLASAGGIGGGIGFAGGALGGGLGAGADFLGKTIVSNTLSDLLKADTRAANREIKDIVGPSFKEVREIAKRERAAIDAKYANPELPPEPVSKGMRASDYVKEHKAWTIEKDKVLADAEKNKAKDLAEWARSNKQVIENDVKGFAGRFVDNPDLFTKWSGRATTDYQKAMAKTGGAMKGAQLKSEFTNIGSYLAPGGLGALTGAGIGYASNQDLLGSALAGAAAGPFARTALTQYALTPGLQTLGKVATGAVPATGGMITPAIADRFNAWRNK
jgi:hypothetical protein